MSEGDAVKVCVRVRPLIQREQGDQVNLLWKAERSTISQVDGTKSFNFDRVFHSHETTSQVYQEIAVPIIQSALQGYNGTIFAYGQTSSGKTYTMMGTPKSLGIIPQAIQEVFKIIQEIPNREFLLRVSYMEIYNETVTDLLCDDRKKKPLEIREDINRNVYVADLTEELVMVPEHVMQWIKKGEKNRHYGETKMNEHSSRSHTIFRMIVESRDRNDPGNSENCDGAVMVSHLNLVDLAGSERASQTGAEGVRLKEGCNINRSLFILGQVIKRLSDGQAGGFINYRDSKLTRILQNSLGGNAKTLIICTVTPVSFDETLSTLQFASTAKHMRNTPHVNEVLDDQALLKRYRKEIMDLKKQLEDLETSSEGRAQAMAKEEHSQLLAEIKLLQKEKEERIWNLTNIVVASSQESQDQRMKRKRRVTWAPGKIQSSLCSATASGFDLPSRIATNFNKKAKFSDLTPFPEIDDSVCTEFSDFDDPSRIIDDFGTEAEWNFPSKVTRREKTSLCQSMMDFVSEGPMADSLQLRDVLQKSKEMEMTVADLEKRLKDLTKEHEEEAEKRKASVIEIASLQQQLLSKEEEKDELVKRLEQKIADLEGQLQAQSVNTEMSLKANSIVVDGQTYFDNDGLTKERTVLADSGYSTLNYDIQESTIEAKLQNGVHDNCKEEKKMLEIKIADLEEIIENLSKQKHSSEDRKSHEQDFMESVQLCEVLMSEKGNALEELAAMHRNFDSIVLENEALKREIAELECNLKEKNEINEFEELEKETQKEQEAQLIHEIGSLKKLVENAELYNQNLEDELESKTKFIKEQEKQLLELRKHSDQLQRKVRNFDLSASMGDSEKLCEEIFQLQQSLNDAEAVTRDAQKECAFLRSENLQLKEKMEEISNWYKKKEKDAAMFEKQLETEKINYKKMQADLQKELQCAFSEINQLNGLMAGKVPKDLLSRVELDKKIADYSKQLDKALEEKNALEKEVTCLSEYKCLQSEVEYLKNQINETSEELKLLKSEKEHTATTISNQECILQEQSEQIVKLTDEVTLVQSRFQQTEEQYVELKKMYDELHEKYLCTTDEIARKQSESEALSSEMEQLRHAMDVKINETSEELKVLKNEKEHSATTISNQECILQEQSEQIVKLSDEVTLVQSRFQQAEEQYVELKKMYEELHEKYMCTTDEIARKQSESEVLSNELEQLKHAMNLKLTTAVELEEALICERGDHAQDKLVESLKDQPCSPSAEEKDRNLVYLQLPDSQNVLAITKEREEMQKSIEMERDSLKEQVNNLSSLVQMLQEQAAKQSELHKEKQDFEEAHHKLISEVEQLQETLKDMQTSLDDMQMEKFEVTEKLQALQQELKNISQERNALQVNLEDLKTERDSLQQDLRENIEVSIETQDELRAAHEELKQQKQLVDNLRRQMADTTQSTMLKMDQSSDVEEKMSSLIEKLHETEVKYQDLHAEREELERAHQVLISEMELLREHMKAAEVALEKMTGEKLEATQKLCALERQLISISEERDVIKKMQEGLQEERDRLKEEVEKHVCKINHVTEELNLMSEKPLLDESELKLNQLQVSVLPAQEEQEDLQEILRSVRAERDQLKLDLQKNIELSIETQAELSGVQDELRKKTLLLEEIKFQGNDQITTQENPSMCVAEVSENKMMLSSQLNSLTSERNQLSIAVSALTEQKQELMELVHTFERERDELKERLQEEFYSSVEQIKQDTEQYRAQLEEEKASKQELQSQLEETGKKAKELESLLNNLSENLQETSSKYQKAMEGLELISRERDQLLLTLDSLRVAHDALKNEQKELNRTYEQIKEDCERYAAQLEEEKANKHQLQSKMEDKNQKLEELERELNNKLEQLLEAGSKYETVMETLELVSKEKEQLLLNLETLQVAHESLKKEKVKETKDKDLQTSYEMHTLEADESVCVPEAEQKLHSEKLYLLQQQLNCVLQEREELQQLTDNLKEERSRLMGDLLKYSEHVVICSGEDLPCNSQKDLEEEIMKLKAQLNIAERQQALKQSDFSAMETCSEEETTLPDGNAQNNTQAACFNNDDLVGQCTVETELKGSQLSYAHELRQLEVSLMSRQSLLDVMQDEKLALTNKLENLKEDLQNATTHTAELECKLESLRCENVLLKENMDNILNCKPDSVLEENLCSGPNETRLGKKTVYYSLAMNGTCVVLWLPVGPGGGVTECIWGTCSYQSSETQDQLQKTREELERQTQLVNQLRVPAAENPSTQGNEKTEYEQSLEEKVKSQFGPELKQIISDATGGESSLPQMPTKHPTMGIQEDQDGWNGRDSGRSLLDLEGVVCGPGESFHSGSTPASSQAGPPPGLLLERRCGEAGFDGMAVEAQILRKKGFSCEVISIMIQVLLLQEELQQKAIEQQLLHNSKADLEQTQDRLRCEMEVHVKALLDTQSALASIQQEKQEIEQQLVALKMQMETVAQEREEQWQKLEGLTAERDQLKNDLEENCELVVLPEGKLQLSLQFQILHLLATVREYMKVLFFKNELEQKTSEQQQKLNETKELEQSQSRLQFENEQLLNSLKDKESSLERLHETEQELTSLRQQLEVLMLETDDLKSRQESLTAERDQLKEDLKENVEMSIETQDDLRRAQEELQQQTHKVKELTGHISDLEDKISSLEEQLIQNISTLKETINEGNSINEYQQQLASEREQLCQSLKSKDLALEQAEKEKNEAAKKIRDLTEEIKTMSQKIVSLEEQIIQNVTTLKDTLSEKEVLNQSKHQMTSKMEQLSQFIKSKDLALEQAEKEKDDATKKIFDLTEEMRTMSKKISSLEEQVLHVTTLNESLSEREVLNQSKEQLVSEMEQLILSLKTKDLALEKAEREKGEAAKKVADFSEKISSLEEKMLQVATTLKETLNERDILGQSKQQLLLEIEQLSQFLKDKDLVLEQAAKEKCEASKEILDLTEEKRILSEKISSLEEQKLHNATALKETLAEQEVLCQSNQLLTTEIEKLSKALKDKDVALQQAEKERCEAVNKMLELTEKASSLEEQVLQNVTSLKEAHSEREALSQSKKQLSLQMEQLSQSLKSKDLTLDLLEKEKVDTAKKIAALLEEIKIVSEERDVFKCSKETLQEEKPRKQHTFFPPNSTLDKIVLDEWKTPDKCLTLPKRFAELYAFSEVALARWSPSPKTLLDKEVLEPVPDLEICSYFYSNLFVVSKKDSACHPILNLEDLNSFIVKIHFHQESLRLVIVVQDCMHALTSHGWIMNMDIIGPGPISESGLPRSSVRYPERHGVSKDDVVHQITKKSIQLKKELNTCQTELETISKQKDELNEHLAEKVNKLDGLLLEVSSLQQQLDQIQQVLTSEKLKNFELCEKVDLMEKEISVLRLMQNEPLEEDEIAERMDTLEKKNEDIKELMVKISAVYTDHHSLLNNLSIDIQKEIEAQKQSMCNIKESLSSTMSRSFGSLQTEHLKLNSQLQTLLHRLKVVYRTNPVKEEHYSMIKDCERDLSAEQKRHDELQLRLQCLEQHGTKWTDSASDELKFLELEFLNNLLLKKMDLIKHVEDDFSEVQVVLNEIGSQLQEEVKCKQGFLHWLEEYTGLNIDPRKLNEVVQQENKRITGIVQLLTKKLKVVVQSKTQREVMAYLNQFEVNLQEKKEKSKELMQKIESLNPAGNTSVMEEENARLLEKVKTLQAEVKKMQSKIQKLEDELDSVKVDALQKEEKVALLQKRLLSRVAESELTEMQAKLTEKENNLQTAMKEIQNLKEKLAQGELPYREKIDNLKTLVVKLEMERTKLTKSMDQEITSLKSCLEDKEEYLRNLKEQLRRTQADNDATVCVGKVDPSYSSFPLTCGGGSGIVQSTAMLVLQSEKELLEKELSRFKKKYSHLSMKMSQLEELKKLKGKVSDEHSSHIGASQATLNKPENVMQSMVSPKKSEIPSLHAESPKKTELPRKRGRSPSKSDIHGQHSMSPVKSGIPKKCALSPNKTGMLKPLAMSPGKTGMHKLLALSPSKTEGPLFSSLTVSPCKKQNLQENLESPKNKFFDVRSKSLPYCPTQFFDNSNLGTLIDLNTAENAADTSQSDNWWYKPNKDAAPECKTS
ncbi:centromere-associated protein E [Rhinophrynus dorsalis]